MKTIKNDEKYFFVILKAYFIPEIFKVLSWHFGYVEKWLDKNGKVNFKILDVTDCTTNNYNTHILKK